MTQYLFRSIFALGSKSELEARWVDIDDTLADRFPKATESVLSDRTDVLAFTASPSGHRRKIWFNHPLDGHERMPDNRWIVTHPRDS